MSCVVGSVQIDNVCVVPISGSITTSASTVPTVSYLSLYQLENYKKTFQSFWIPFMEQFIPATTIWVAGERWCNEPCTIIDPCDYDFELTEAEIGILPVPPGFFPPGAIQVGSGVSEVPQRVSSTPIGTTPTIAEKLTNTPNIVQTKDLGLVTSKNIILTEVNSRIDLQAYRSKFTAPIIQTIVA